MSGIHKIEISFPGHVELPAGFEQALDALINMVCEKYEEDHPDRTMWPAGHGGKPMGNIMFDDNVDYDMGIYCIDIAEREAHPKEIERRKRQ